MKFRGINNIYIVKSSGGKERKKSTPKSKRQCSLNDLIKHKFRKERWKKVAVEFEVKANVCDRVYIKKQHWLNKFGMLKCLIVLMTTYKRFERSKWYASSCYINHSKSDSSSTTVRACEAHPVGIFVERKFQVLMVITFSYHVFQNLRAKNILNLQ